MKYLSALCLTGRTIMSLLLLLMSHDASSRWFREVSGGQGAYGGLIHAHPLPRWLHTRSLLQQQCVSSAACMALLVDGPPCTVHLGAPVIGSN